MTEELDTKLANIAGTLLRVSRVGLGTWAIGGWMWGGTDEEESVKTIHAAVERGINLIDTAPAYGFGRSEEIVGRAIADRDLRLTDPKFQPPRYSQYIAAVRRLDQFARHRYVKRVIHLAVRWLLDQGATTALWGARHPGQLRPIDEVFGWSLDAAAKAEIDRILRNSITDPIGPEFMAPPPRPRAELFQAAAQ